MRQVKLTLPDDVVDWLDSELGASHGTRGTVAGDIVQAAHLASRGGFRELKFPTITLSFGYRRCGQTELARFTEILTEHLEKTKP